MDQRGYDLQSEANTVTGASVLARALSNHRSFHPSPYLAVMSERYKFVDGHAHFISCAFVSSIKDAAYIWSNADAFRF